MIEFAIMMGEHLFTLGGEITMLAITVALIVIAVSNIVLRVKAQADAELTKQKLNQSLCDLKAAYDEVYTTRSELTDKYNELKKSREHMKEVAYIDMLTGLPNRVAFIDKLNNCINRVNPIDNEYMLLINLDIDNFKLINDSIGLQGGDVIIRSVADRLLSIVKKDEVLSRSGGDSFLLLFHNLMSREECENKVLEVMHIFNNSHFYGPNREEFTLTASLGAEIVPCVGNHTILETMRNVDTALQIAKDSGRNTFRIFDSYMEQTVRNKVRMQTELKTALLENQFELFYQPQVNLDSNKVGSFEALIRWHHPSKGLLLPAEFIPMAEESNIILDIGKETLKKALKQLAEWQNEGKMVTMAVNLSARQFRDPFLINYLLELIVEYNLNPTYIDLEITETVALEDMEYTIHTLDKLRRMGITVSLDDFGTGYSSLNYLRSLPVDNLKIDKSFLDAISNNEKNLRIVETIVHLAKILNISVIAEGVENQAQEALLKNLSCAKAQGYLYSRPVPATRAGEMI